MRSFGLSAAQSWVGVTCWHCLENIQAGNVTFQTTVNHENKTSEEAEMEDVIAKDA